MMKIFTPIAQVSLFSLIIIKTAQAEIVTIPLISNEHIVTDYQWNNNSGWRIDRTHLVFDANPSIKNLHADTEMSHSTSI